MLINLPEPESVTNIELKNGDIVFCCNFEDFNHIYLCKSSKNTIPQNNNFIIDASKIKDITIKKNPKRGEILKVKYEEKIFRAKVLDAFGKMYTVFLIDIGKNISVSADEVFEISNESKNVPGLAQKVGLKGAKDLKITKTVKDYFHNLWFNVPVPLILMCDEDNFNCFNEVNLKRLNNEHDIIDDLLNICNTLSNDNINQLKPIVQNSKSNGSSVHWRIPSGEHVEFLFGNNVENIHVRPIKLYEDYKNILNEFKNGKNDHLKTICPKTNENVAVYSMKYNGFYRAKIIGPCSDDTSMFRCSFSDYSFIDSISLKHIFELPISESVNTVPILCQRVSLAGLTKINNNNSRVISYLGQLVGNTLILEYDKKAERWYKQVILKDLKNLSINEEIQKLCQPMSQQRRLERKIVIPEKKENELVKPIHPIKSGSTVYITHFENFNSIFIRDASHEFIESFNKFNKQMIKYYKSACVNRSSNKLLNIGDKVCVISTLNPIMYCRAQIKDKINDEFRVFCIDYGNEELVCAEDIFELPKELEKVCFIFV
uniref:Tudor domain-containing protein n=2 Tax=Sipha flava TaxID=143950 RepID=A0A2S2R425_9HEMI